MRNSTLHVLVFLLFSSVTLAQNQVKLDSLQLQFQNAEADTLKVQLLVEIARLYLGSNYQLAAQYMQRAQELAQKKDLKKLEARTNQGLGGIFFLMGDYKNASTYFYDALRYFEQEGDTTGTIIININLGAVNDRLQKYDNSLTCYLQAQQLLNTAQSVSMVSKNRLLPTLFNNIGNIYEIKQDIRSAQQYYERALQYAEQNNNLELKGIALNNIGKLHFKYLNQPDKALAYLQKALRVREELGNKAELSKSYIQLSNYYFVTQDFVKAKVAAQEAIKLGQEIGSLETQMEGYESLSMIEEANGNHQRSLFAFKEFKRLSDSIQHQHSGSEIARLQLQYDFEKAEKARAEEKEKLRLRYITIIVVLSVFLLVAVLITVLIRSRARQTELKRKNLAQDVEIKNKELTTNVMYLIRKNELINNVAERLLQFEKTASAENQKIIHDIILDLQREADSDTWKEFELRFNQVHSEFYNNLRKLYPGLSPADEKLCAFLRLNMSSKEIAAITQQSFKSVEVARARLRKKLSLTNTTSNLVTHLSNL